MSRIGKKIIAIPEKTEVTVAGSKVTVKGPLGELTREFPALIEIKKEGNTITLAPKKETKDSSPLWGTASSHIQNMIAGVNTLFQKKLIIEGIGFKSDVKPNDITLSLGFSHTIKMDIPKTVKVVSEKGGILSITGIDKEAVGQFAASIRSLKKPEPYKGKGVRYDTETIRRKQGKKTT